MEHNDLLHLLEAKSEYEFAKGCSNYFEKKDLFKVSCWYSVFLERQAWYRYLTDHQILGSEVWDKFEASPKKPNLLNQISKPGLLNFRLEGISYSILSLGEASGMVNLAFLVFENLDPLAKKDFFEKDFSILVKICALHSKMKSLAILDSLTNVYNHAFFGRIIQSEFSRACRLNQVLTLLYIDLDHFKNINSEFGHEEGSNILIQVAKVLHQNVRLTDHVIRMGGDEFVVLLHSQKEEAAWDVAERLRKSVETHAFQIKKRFFQNCKKEVSLTVSIGVYSIKSGEVKQFEDLMKALRQCNFAMKEAKKERNKILAFESISV
jgi:diguanylate cyclase (GGDEF)-like protein